MNDSRVEALLESLRLLNRLRRNAEAESARLTALEADFEKAFNVSCKLAVYGSLAPGRINHPVVAEIEGQWMSGLVVRGQLIAEGWGAGLGYPALKWMTDGPEVEVQLLVSAQLPEHWPRLDEFEGAEYQRILAPLYRQGACVTVANLYEWKNHHV